MKSENELIKSQLRDLRAELRKISSASSSSHKEKISTLDAHIDEVLEEMDDKFDYASLKSALNESVATFQKEYPNLTQIMMGVSNMLSSIGI